MGVVFSYILVRAAHSAGAAERWKWTMKHSF